MKVKKIKTEKIERTVAVIMVLGLILCLIPLLAISIYDHPCADDFSYGLLAHQAWSKSGSLLQTIAAAAQKTAERYENWQGTFSSIFLMAIQPAVFSDGLYVVTPFIMLGMLTIGNICFLREFLQGILKASKAQMISVSCGLTAISIQLMFSPVEGIYWYNGAIHYIFMYSCMLLMIAAVLHAMRLKKKIFVLWACLLGLIVGGGNYVTALTAILLEVVIMIVLLVYGLSKSRPVGYWLCPTLASLIGLLISGLAPGNRVRQANLNQKSVPEAILSAFKDGASFLLYHTPILYIAFLLFLIPFALRIARASGITFRLPGLMLAGSFCLICAMFAPMEYTAGISYIGRTANVILLMIELAGFLNEIYLLGWLDQKFHLSSLKINEGKGMAFYLLITACICMVTVLSTYRTRTYTSITAILSWKSGELSDYDSQIRSRLELLENEEEEDLQLAALTQHPTLLYFDDITEDQSDWRNKAMARFYGKKSVVIK